MERKILTEEDKINLRKTQDVTYITKSDGKKMMVRHSRKRYFYPDEWDNLYYNIREKNRFIFDVLIMTGARIEEALFIKVGDINLTQSSILLRVTKMKAKKKEKKPDPRTISFNIAFKKKFNAYVLDNKLGEFDFLFLNNKIKYESRIEEKKEAKKKKSAVYQLFKRALGRTSAIKDPWNFSLHNIRKTHGMWLKTMDVKFEEICGRLGHDSNTYLKSYGSADIFTHQQKIDIRNKLKGIYGL